MTLYRNGWARARGKLSTSTITVKIAAADVVPQISKAALQYGP